MLKKQNLELFCLLFFISGLIALGVFVLFGDALFFGSDVVSTFIVVMSMSLVIFPIVALMCAVVMLLSRPVKDNMNIYAAGAAESLIVSCFVLFIFNSIDPRLSAAGHFSRQIYSHLSTFGLDFLWVVLWVAVFIVFYRNISAKFLKNVLTVNKRLIVYSVTPVITVLLYALSRLCSYIIAGLFPSNIFKLNSSADILILASVAISVILMLVIIIYDLLLILGLRHRAVSHMVRNKISVAIVLTSLLSLLIAYTESRYKYIARLSYVPAKYLSRSESIQTYLYLAIWAVVVIFILLLLLINVRRAGNKKPGTFIQRTAILITPAFIVLFLYFVFFDKQGDIRRHNNEPFRHQHVVLIVLDGLPSKFIPLFSGQNDVNTDAFIYDSGLVFSNVHTNAVWTNAYFGTLYSGRPIDQPLSVTGPSKNLLSVLQENGVRIRSYLSHRNAFPESSASRIVNYNGFRSIYSSSLFVPLFDALGLEYGLNLEGVDQESKEEDVRRKVAAAFLPLPMTYNNEGLRKFFLHEIQVMQRQSERSLLIFHVPWPVFSSDKPLPKELGNIISSDIEKKMWEKITINNNHYVAEDAPYVENLRCRIEFQMKDVLSNMSRFSENAKQMDLMKNTLIIFTADHGSIYSEGRMLYRYHPQEQVTSVPVIAFGLDRTGIDERSFETIDLTRTITDYFGIDIQYHPRARSMLKTGEKTFTECLTNSSKNYREWFIVIYKGGKKYVFNIHPEGKGEGLEQVFIDRVRTETVRSDKEIIDELVPELEQAFADYKLDILPEKEVHPDFIRFLKKKSL